MAGSTFGHLFRVTTFGESHGGAVGGVVDGCPPGLALSEGDLQSELDRRKPGQSDLTTPRKEEDTVRIVSGVFNGETTGTPIAFFALSKDVRSEDYSELKDLFRPSHADMTYVAKYGRRDWRGSGRASARETLARVGAGAIAQKLLRERHQIEIVSGVEQVGHIRTSIDWKTVTRTLVDSNNVRCPDSVAAAEMARLIEEVRDDGDSIGGVIRGIIRGVPPGLGEPVFDKLHADLGKAMLSINAVKGFEIGMGFAAAELRGSEHNDPFEFRGGQVRAPSNRSGGVLGGITTGEEIVFRVAFKPVATIAKTQSTVTVTGSPANFAASGRHDPCVLPRAVPIVDAMAALVVVDHLQMQRSRA
jgi:chorismate synthase